MGGYVHRHAWMECFFVADGATSCIEFRNMFLCMQAQVGSMVTSPLAPTMLYEYTVSGHCKTPFIVCLRIRKACEER